MQKALIRQDSMMQLENRKLIILQGIADSVAKNRKVK